MRGDGRTMEDRITEMREYEFLFDNDSQAAARFFPEKRVITLAQAKVSTAASDAEIVARARELGAIIVTANGEDYEKEIKRFLHKSQRNDCYDLFGLVVIPNPAAIQEKVLPGLAAKPRFNGTGLFTFPHKGGCERFPKRIPTSTLINSRVRAARASKCG